MPVVPLKEIVDRALADRYGVAAINVLNDLTLEAVLQAAVDERSPVIVQTSVKTVESIGAEVLFDLWRGMTAGIEVPVSLHLDHCPDRAVISRCLRLGWNSVLFDASEMPVAENQRQTIEVVAEARSYGAHVEGEIETIADFEDGQARRSRPNGRPCRPAGSSSSAPASTSSPRPSATPTACTAARPSWTSSGSAIWWSRPVSRSPCTAVPA